MLFPVCFVLYNCAKFVGQNYFCGKKTKYMKKGSRSKQEQYDLVLLLYQQQKKIKKKKNKRNPEEQMKNHAIKQTQMKPRDTTDEKAKM